MNSFCMKLAGRTIHVDTIYPSTESFCSKYKTENTDNFDFSVSVTDEDIIFEKEKSWITAIREGTAIQNYSNEYLETLALYRKIATELPLYDTILMHGSAIAVDGKTYLFTAKSGTGKSTHARLWREHFKDRAVMVNDDKPLITIGEHTVIHGTPWNGKHRLDTNISVPLKAICVLERGAENTIEKVESDEVYHILLQQIFRPMNIEALHKTLTLIDRLTENTPIYRLHCNMSPEAAVVSYNGMQERN